MPRELVPEGNTSGVRAFARAFVDAGGNPAAAAREVGATEGAAKGVGTRLLGRADVQAAIVQATKDKADVLAPMMLSVLTRLALDSDVRPATRKDAALGVLAHSSLREGKSTTDISVPSVGITLIGSIQAERAKRLGNGQVIDMEGKTCPASYLECQTANPSGEGQAHADDGE